MSDTATLDVPTAVFRPPPPEFRVPVAPPWQAAVVRTLQEVESLLDLAERMGHQAREFTPLDGGGFRVRWR